MADEHDVQAFHAALTADAPWMARCLRNPRPGGHGPDPWAIEVDIEGEPILISFKFRQHEPECCINLRVAQGTAAFNARIRQLFGEQFEAIGVGISGAGRHAYFKPFGTRNGALTRDVFFPVGNPPDLNLTAEVGPCHSMPEGGKASLRTAVLRVLQRMGLGPEQPAAANAEAAEVAPPAAELTAEPAAAQVAQGVATAPLAAQRQAVVQPARPARPLVNQIMHFLHDHCTGGKPENQRRFVTELKGLLEQTTLQTRTPEALWPLMWEKPIYANQNNDVATQVIQRCRQQHLFDDFSQLPHDQPGQVPLLDGLRAPAEKLARIHRLAGTVHDVHRLHQATLQALEDPAGGHAQNSQADDFDSIRNLIGVPPHAGRQPSLYQVVHALQGFGGITELHMLVDFGFPVCKPDLWIVRTVIALLQVRDGNRPDLVDFVRQKHPEFTADGLDQAGLNRRPWYSFRVLDYIVRNELDFQDPFFAAHGIDASVRFRGHRLADLMVAKFGMRPEQRFGLMQSPLDRLNTDSSLSESWPELARLAAALRQQ